MKTTLRHFIFASIGSVLLILAGCMDDQKKPEEKKKEEPQTNVEKKEEPPKTEDKQKEETLSSHWKCKTFQYRIKRQPPKPPRGLQLKFTLEVQNLPI